MLSAGGSAALVGGAGCEGLLKKGKDVMGRGAYTTHAHALHSFATVCEGGGGGRAGEGGGEACVGRRGRERETRERQRRVQMVCELRRERGFPATRVVWGDAARSCGQ